jgi:mycofactocin glycosyltransferase
MNRFRLDSSWSRPRGGTIALGGSPLTLFRLTPGGQQVADALEHGNPLPDGHEPLTDRLIAAGALHPEVVGARSPHDVGRASNDAVDVVIPVYDEDPNRLTELVAALRRSASVGDVVIVDDASPAPLRDVEGARVVRLEVNGGPAQARNAGVAATTAPLVLFVDADITLDSDDADALIDALCRHLDDDAVAVAAPRVVARSGTGRLAAFDAARSPLDLGPEPARVRALTRVSYVPAAMVLVRRCAFVDLGGFDASMRFGEDVDLVWRFDTAGWRCRYEPAVVASHDVRPDLSRWLRQRRNYGTSAAPLALRHGPSVSPLRLSRWSLAAWGTAAAGHPLIGLTIAAATTAEFARRIGDIPGRARVAVRYAGFGHLHAGRLIARSLTRTWWPLALAAALVSRRARRVLATAVLVPPVVEWWTKRPSLDPVSYVMLSLADDVAYGTGVWIGCWRERDLRAIAPSITR